jgi:hypothetical protein
LLLLPLLYLDAADGSATIADSAEAASIIVIEDSSSSDDGSSDPVGSSSDSSDPDDPVSRAARSAAVQIGMLHSSQIQCCMQHYFKPISCAEYRSQIATAAETDIMDLRNVKALPAADEVSSSDNCDEDLVASPKRRRHGYELNDFVVGSSESESDRSQSSTS